MNDLKPVNIIQAAERDIGKSSRNAGHKGGSYEAYAFHREHVRKAFSALELIELAASDHIRGACSGKKWTRIVYSNPELLKEAAALARSEPRT